MKKLRKIAITAGLSIVLLVLLVVVLAGMPFVLDMVKARVEHMLEQELAVQTRITSLRGNILYAIEASDIEIGHAATVQKLRISYDLIKILRGEIDIRSVSIEGLNLNADSIQTLFSKRDVSPDTATAQPSPLKLQIRNFTIVNSYLHGDFDLTDVHAQVFLVGRLTNNEVTIDSLFIATDSSSCALQGTLLLDSTFAADIMYNLDIALGDLGIDGLAGTIVNSGYVQGNITEPIITNSTHIVGYYQNMLIAGEIDAYWRLPMLDSIQIDGHVTARSVPHIFQHVPDSTFNIVVHIKEKTFRCEVTSSLAQARIEGLAKGDLTNPDVEARVTASLLYEGMKGTVDISGCYREHSLNVRSLTVKTDAAVVTGYGIVDTEAQRIKVQAQVQIADVGRLNTFLRDTLPVAGRVSVTAQVNGSLPDPRVSAEIELKDVTAYGEYIGEARVTVLHQNSRIEVTNGSIRAERGVILLDGSYDVLEQKYSASVQSDSLLVSIPYYFGGDTIPLNGFASFQAQGSGSVYQPQAEITLLLKNVVYDTIVPGDLQVHAVLAQQVLSLNAQSVDGSIDLVAVLRLDETTEFDAELILHRFDLTRFVPLDTGIVSARLSAHSRFDHPENAVVNLTVDTVFVRKEQTVIRNTGTIVLEMNNGILTLDTCNLSINNHLVTARGTVPINKDSQDLSLDLNTEKITVSDVLLMIPDAPHINGTIEINATVRGTVQNPVINGMLIGEHLGFTFDYVVIDSVNALVRFQNSHVVADDISGKINKGRFSIKGFANIAETGIDTMNVTATIRGVDIAHPSVGNGVVSADIRSIARMDSIKLSGEVTLDKGTYDVPFNHQTIINLLTRVNQPPPEQTDFVKRTYCDIGVSSTRSIAIKNNIADIGVDADLQIRGYLSRLNVYGTIATARRGALKYLGKKFDIERAVIQFDDPYKIDPVLDLEATSFVSADDGDYEIRLYITGTAEKWSLRLQSAPPVPEQDIISLLILGRRRPGIPAASAGKNAGLKGAAMDYAMNLARGQIEKTGERALGLDKLTITGDLLDPRKLGIGVEKRIARRLTVVYGTGIESWELRRIGVNYEINDNVWVSTLHDQENENSSVDLNFRFKAR
ncbi:MAG: translocation/assembly module TamB domain-containing protein [candidate division WOR-3 bacterium]|nr:MAG: translocation/assembly module TamB domain-containing protein [candidate division WOR-3 bacterium]